MKLACFLYCGLERRKGDRGLAFKTFHLLQKTETSQVSWEKSELHYSVASVLGFIPFNSTTGKATHINLESN